MLFAFFEYVGTDFAADMARMAADPKQIPLDERRPGDWWAVMTEVFHTGLARPPAPLFATACVRRTGAPVIPQHGFAGGGRDAGAGSTTIPRLSPSSSPEGSTPKAVAIAEDGSAAELDLYPYDDQAWTTGPTPIRRIIVR